MIKIFFLSALRGGNLMAYLLNKDDETVKRNSVTEGLNVLIQEFKDNRTRFLVSFGFNVIASLFFGNIAIQYVSKLFGKTDKIYAFDFSEFFSNPIFILVYVFIVFVLCRAEYIMWKSVQKDYVNVPGRNYMQSKYGSYGTAHEQTEEEMRITFNMQKWKENWTDKPDSIKDPIIGVSDKGYMCALNENLVGINQNWLVFGAAGSGKSESIVKPTIYQGIRSGISMIVTDSKGDLYAETSQLARDNGYIVKVLNFKPEELKNSDGIQFLKRITVEDDIMATTLANQIIENTGDGKMDYFAVNEMNLLKAMLLYVGTSEEHRRAGTNTLAEVFNMFTENDADALAEIFNLLPNGHPAKTAFAIFDFCEPKVKGQILNGMAVRLNLLGNNYIRKITSSDETDFILPMKKRCIYYIVISDTDTSLKFLANLTFTVMFIEQCNYSDGLSKEKKKKQIPVKYILDEMANIGAIPYFDVKISTFRSRKISATMILQSISQLKNIYDKDRWKTIISNVTTKILLKAGEEETAQYFSNLCGTQTIKVKNKKYKESDYDIVKTHPNASVTEGLGKRELFTVDEILGIDNDYLLTCILGHQPVVLKKFLAFRYHPMDKGHKERKPNKHMPKWRKEMMRLEQESN